MSVRVGVDVGGTFTKAVALEVSAAGGSGRIVARAVVPTTHEAVEGVARGVATAVEQVVAQVAATHGEPVQLVGHSTTQAVNALLEGDTATVGILAVGRRPDIERTRARTKLRDVRLAPGHTLHTVAEMVDATDGLERSTIQDALDLLRTAGAEAVCISAAFSVEDPTTERLCLDVATEMGLPACAGHELSGLYGLELRTLTAALNTSILPGALRTAGFVEDAVSRVAPDAALLVMRGDGGAAELRSVRRHPLLTVFSGPAASVVGALHHLRLADGIVIEVGGTSTNVSSIRGGRPVLDYVRVMDHRTHVRSLDVRVAGVAGGSLLRIGRARLGRSTVRDIGPRSAHVSGLPYASFLSPERLTGAEVRLEAPRPGDLPDHVVLHTASGERVALTVTCAANALGMVPPDVHAAGDTVSARLGFEALAMLLHQTWDDLARRTLAIAADKIAAVAADLVAEAHIVRPEIVGLGGGAGALVPVVGERLGWQWRIPPDAEIISSIGDAMAVVRVEMERTVVRGDAAAFAAVHRAAEEAAIAAGAAPDGLTVESEVVPERSAVRVVAVGALLTARTEVAAAGSAPPEEEQTVAAYRVLGRTSRLVARVGCHAVFTAEAGRQGPSFVIIDAGGGIAATGRGEILSGDGAALAERLTLRLPQLTRGFGPIAVAPQVRILRGSRLIDLSVLSAPADVLDAAVSESRLGAGEPVVAILSRS